LTPEKKAAPLDPKSHVRDAENIFERSEPPGERFWRAERARENDFGERSELQENDFGKQSELARKMRSLEKDFQLECARKKS
jgi:hypothetical protein